MNVPPRVSGEPWWRAGTIYQVYPRSFQDTNGDGIGDLNGITSRLDYLADLGVDAIWISPIFPSPMADFGYDVADYGDIDPRFGTMADFDRLLGEAHRRNIRILLDFVPNHSSDQHPWFLESRSSRTNPKRDWYIWRDARPDGSPPNNWISDFGGPAWEWDEATGQYYSHAFLKEQPDLNWRNPEVVEAMLAAMRFWFDRGVDGFRIDVLWHMVKHPEFIDNPLNPDWHAGLGEMFRVHQTHSTDQPEVHEIAARMRALADGHGAVLIGEIYLPFERLVRYYGTDEAPGVHLPFNFTLIDAPWDARSLAALIAEYEAALPPGGWPNWVLGNHDRPRSATRRGPAQARVAQMLLLTLRGTPTLYYGDELGMEDVAIPPALVQDPRELREPGIGMGRDPVRTPMQWEAPPNAGFTTGEPWLPLAPDWRTRNVEVEAGEPGSMLTLVKRLLALRRATPALSTGALALVEVEGDVLAYRRGDNVVVALNLGAEQQRLALPSGNFRLLLSTLEDPAESVSGTLTLRPNEGMIFTRRATPAQAGVQ